MPSFLSAVAFILLASCSFSSLAATMPPIDNPIVVQRADPWLVRHDDGCYTFIGTSPKFDEIELRQACRLNDLKIAEPKIIWRKKTAGPMGNHIWAPELHRIDGSWYIYFAAGDADDQWRIRMYALKNAATNPMEGEWTEAGQIKTPVDSFSLDATTFELKGERYLIWAQQDAARTYNSALWLAKMTSPTTIDFDTVTLLTEPSLDWETAGYKVNEGAAVIIRHGRVLITYSASATDDRYAMGLLWADENADLQNPASWHIKQEPVFTTRAELGRYGPGHNSFVKAEDGITDLMIYHSRDYQKLRGSALSDPNRHARARVIFWDAEGFPVFRQNESD